MKATIKVKKGSAYAYLNGKTFNVKEVLKGKPGVTIYALDVDGRTVDFTNREVLLQL